MHWTILHHGFLWVSPRWRRGGAGVIWHPHWAIPSCKESSTCSLFHANQPKCIWTTTKALEIECELGHAKTVFDYCSTGFERKQNHVWASFRCLDICNAKSAGTKEQTYVWQMGIQSNTFTIVPVGCFRAKREAAKRGFQYTTGRSLRSIFIHLSGLNVHWTNLHHGVLWFPPGWFATLTGQFLLVRKPRAVVCFTQISPNAFEQLILALYLQGFHSVSIHGLHNHRQTYSQIIRVASKHWIYNVNSDMPTLCFIIARRGSSESKTMFGQVSVVRIFVMPIAQERNSKHTCGKWGFNQTHSQLCQLVVSAPSARRLSADLNIRRADC